MDTLFSIIITALIGVLGNYIYEVLHRLFKRGKPETLTPTQKLQSLIDNLSKSSREADAITQEIVADLKKREAALAELQTRNAQLSAEEDELKKRIAALKEVPIEVAEYFQRINRQNIEKVDKRSGLREILFFILGAIISVVIQLLIG